MFKRMTVLTCLLLLGACRAQPPLPADTVCPDIYMPVCGADGRNYPNACEAQKAGQAYQSGECRDMSIQPII